MKQQEVNHHPHFFPDADKHKVDYENVEQGENECKGNCAFRNIDAIT